MSFESPESPRDAMEARLTALLLGELSAEEEGTLRAAIAQDPALAQLRERLARTLGLVREAAGSLREETTPPAEALRLSAERREKLLQQFKVVARQTPVPARRPTVHWRELAAVAAMLMALLAVAALHFAPKFNRARSASSAVLAGRTDDAYGLDVEGFIVASKSESLVAGSVTPEPLARSKSTVGAYDVAPVAKFFAEAGVEKKKESTQPPARPASPSRGSEIALPQVGQTAGLAGKEGEALGDFDSVAVANRFTDLSAYAIVPQDRNVGTIGGRVAGAGQGFAGGGIGLGGLVAPAGTVSTDGFLAYSTSAGQVASDGGTTVTIRPSSAPRVEFKSAGLTDGEKRSFVDSTDTEAAGIRELRESVVRQQVAAVDKAWMAPVPALPASVPSVVPPPAPPVAVALNPVSRVVVDAEDFVARDTGVTRQLIAKDQRDGTVGDAQDEPMPLLALTPAPAAKPAEPTAPLVASTPMSGTFAGRYINGTATAPTRGNSLAPVAAELENLSATTRQLDGVALQRANGTAFNTPAAAQSAGGVLFREPNFGGARPEPTELAIRDRALSSDSRVLIEQADKLKTDAARKELTDAKSEKQRDESQTRFGTVALDKQNAIIAKPAEEMAREKRPEFSGNRTLLESSGETATEKSETHQSVGLTISDVSGVLDRYEKLTGRSVLRPASIPEMGITVRSSTPLPVDEEIRALDSILSMNGISMIPQGAKFVKAVTEAQAGNSAPSVGALSGDSIALSPASRDYVTHAVQITNSSPNDVLPVLEQVTKTPNRILTIPSSGFVVLRDKAENVARMVEILTRLDSRNTANATKNVVDQGRSPDAPVPQPEVSAADNAFSTFSLNVSDVSFKLAAAALEKGQMPDAATIRSEEFINAFDYRDAEPGGSAPIAFAWERARYPFAHDRDLIRLSVKTAASGRQPGRPLNIVLLIDNSGSMERADRVRIRQECLRVLAAQLQPQDRVSVVSFARTARLWVDGLSGGQAGELPQRVGNLTPEGGTNLEEAMNLAYQTALRHFLASGVNRVVLLTDGAANLGDVQPGSLKKKVEAHRRQGVALDCFGIGWDGLNDELLEALSRNGDGRYGFVNTPEAAASEFAGQLAGALKVAASDVKVQVEWNPRRVTAYRQIGYAKHQLKKEQFRDNTVDAAEIGAAEAGNALYTVQVNPRGEGPLGTVRVRFKVPSSGDYREHEWPLDYDGSARPLEQSSAALRLAASASAFSEWLVSSPFAGEVTPDKLLGYLSGVPESWPADPRPKKLEWMIRQAKSVSGK